MHVNAKRLSVTSLSKNSVSCSLALVVLLLLISTISYAETLAEAMDKCRLVSNSLKRLVCYDQLAQRANTLDDSELQEFYARRPGVSLLPNAGEDHQILPPQPVIKPKNTFGLEEKMEREEKELDSEMVAVVGKVRTNNNYKLVITMEDGAIWTQTDTSKMKLKTGDTVIISRGWLGSFYLKKQDGKKSIRVRRNS